MLFRSRRGGRASSCAARPSATTRSAGPHRFPTRAECPRAPRCAREARAPTVPGDKGGSEPVQSGVHVAPDVRSRRPDVPTRPCGTFVLPAQRGFFHLRSELEILRRKHVLPAERHAELPGDEAHLGDRVHVDERVDAERDEIGRAHV